MFSKIKLSQKKKNFFFCELFLKGTGLRSIRISNVLFLKLGYSHYISINIPTNIYIITKRDKLIIFGLFKDEVSAFSNTIKYFRQPNSYKLKGIIVNRQIPSFKVGKQR